MGGTKSFDEFNEYVPFKFRKWKHLGSTGRRYVLVKFENVQGSIIYYIQTILRFSSHSLTQQNLLEKQ